MADSRVLGDFPGMIDLLWAICYELDDTIPPMGTTAWQSELELAYQIWLRIGGMVASSETGNYLHFGQVTADGTNYTSGLSVLNGKIMDTDFWFIHSQSKRDISEFASGTVSGAQIHWLTDFAPPAGTIIYYAYTNNA